MGALIQHLLDDLSPVTGAIISLSILLGALATILGYTKKAILAIRDFIENAIRPNLPGVWKTMKPVAIPAAFLAALIVPVGYAIWYFLFLSVTHIDQVSNRSAFLSLFYQETTLIVLYCVAWAVAAHFWILPRIFPRKKQ